MKGTLAAGMRKAHEPIMIGKPVPGFMPSIETITRHGAYRPTPIVISAPSAKFPAIPAASSPPVNPIVPVVGCVQIWR